MYKQILSCLLILFIICFTPVKANDEVVFVSSYSKSMEANRGMFNVLIKDFKLDFKKHIFYLNSKGMTADIVKRESIPILATIKEINPSIVFLSDDNALKFLGPGLIQNGIKIVALGINANPRLYFDRENFHNVYGVLERPLLLRGILKINHLVGHKDNAIILSDDSESGKILIKSIFQDRTTIRLSNTNITYMIVKNLKDIEKKLKYVDQNSTHLFLSSIHSIKISEQSAELLNFHQVLNWLTDNYKSNYYSFWKDYIIPNGAHISYGIDLTEHATIALEIGYLLLKDTPPKLHFVTPNKGKIFQLE